jgi:NADH:ubiquinone oxidoreductase subunit K
MNNKIFTLIAGTLSVILFWIGWVSLNPSDKKAMARFISVENLLNNKISSRTKLGGIVKNGSIQISQSNQ